METLAKATDSKFNTTRVRLVGKLTAGPHFCKDLKADKSLYFCKLFIHFHHLLVELFWMVNIPSSVASL